MELDFDNEIDALMRREAAGRTITVSEFAGMHLDADEIAAFAENAVPERARRTFVEHFAACDMCRKTLSNAVSLNAGEVPESAASVVAPAEIIAAPWYRRLFLFPNLAYVMGGLVVLFAGFIGLSVLYSSFGGRSSDVSRVSENRPAPAYSEPAEDLSLYNSNANTASSSASSNVAANASNATSSNSVVSATPSVSAADEVSSDGVIAQKPLSQPRGDESLKESKAAQQPAAAAPPPPPRERNVTLDGVESRRLAEPKATPAPKREEDRKFDLPTSPRMAQSAPTKGKTSSPNDGKDRNVSRDRDNELSSKKSDSSAGTGVAANRANTKRVGARTFEFRQGAWYETTYRGQGTINVRRFTDDYRKLDLGLRGIAESFIGTVVVTIWNGRAYRIQ